MATSAVERNHQLSGETVYTRKKWCLYTTDTAVRTLVSHLDGENVARRVDTGVTVATGENLTSPEIAALLEPDLSILEGR